MSDFKRILYQSEGLYVGPSPSSGFHFGTYAGVPNNDSTDFVFVKDVGSIHSERGEAWSGNERYEDYLPSSPVGAVVYQSGVKDRNQSNFTRNENLIKKIDRLQGINYSISIPRMNVSQLGRKGMIARAPISPPVVALSFNYLVNGVRNEHRLGFNVNYPQMYYPFSGEPLYSGNRFNLLSGMTETELDNRTGHHRGEAWPEGAFTTKAFPVYDSSIQRTGEVLFDSNNKGERAARKAFPDNWPVFPRTYRDKHNFFLHVSSDKNSDEKSVLAYTETSGSILEDSMTAHPNSPTNECLSFGDCQLGSYSIQASIGGLPMASLTYIGSSIQVQNASSGENIPALSPKDGRDITGAFIIPKSFENEGVSVLRPGDMTIDVEASDIGMNTTGLALQSFKFEIDLKRDSLVSLGYQLPIDRPINYPIVAKGSFSVVVGDVETGKLSSFMHIDKVINVSVNMNTDDCDNWAKQLKTGEFYQGVVPLKNHTSVNYSFLGARVENISFNSSIGSERLAQVAFSSELNPEDLTNGFFVSGVINSEKIFNYWGYENSSGVNDDGYQLTDENGSILISDMIPF
jgi:hypothetical protein